MSYDFEFECFFRLFSPTRNANYRSVKYVRKSITAEHRTDQAVSVYGGGNRYHRRVLISGKSGSLIRVPGNAPVYWNYQNYNSIRCLRERSLCLSAFVKTSPIGGFASLFRLRLVYTLQSTNRVPGHVPVSKTIKWVHETRALRRVPPKTIDVHRCTTEDYHRYAIYTFVCQCNLRFRVRTNNCYAATRSYRWCVVVIETRSEQIKTVLWKRVFVIPMAKSNDNDNQTILIVNVRRSWNNARVRKVLIVQAE